MLHLEDFQIPPFETRSSVFIQVHLKPQNSESCSIESGSYRSGGNGNGRSEPGRQAGCLAGWSVGNKSRTSTPKSLEPIKYHLSFLKLLNNFHFFFSHSAVRPISRPLTQSSVVSESIWSALVFHSKQLSCVSFFPLLSCYLSLSDQSAAWGLAFRSVCTSVVQSSSAVISTLTEGESRI